MYINFGELAKYSWFLKPILLLLGLIVAIPRMIKFVFKEIKKITLIDVIEFIIMAIVVVGITSMSVACYFG